MSTAREAIEAAIESLPPPEFFSEDELAMWINYRSVTTPCVMRAVFTEHDAETAALRAQLRESDLKFISLFGEMQNALDKVAELEKDAARYRHVRSIGGATWTVQETGGKATLHLYDAAVDAAIAATQTHEKTS
jgi:hypothetical protein